MHHYGTRLRQDQIDYIREHIKTKGKGSISSWIREAIDEKIQKEKRNEFLEEKPVKQLYC